MFPEIHLFGKHIPMYMIFSLIGIFVMAIYLCKKAKKLNIDDNDVIITMLFSAIGVLVGGHILYGIVNWETIVFVFNNLKIIKNFSDFVNVVFYIFGGSVFYGGLLGGLLAGFIYLKKSKKDVCLMANFLALGIPLFHFFGRLACFFEGCCYGTECQIGFVYHHSLIETANGVIRFPIQLVEACLNLVLFFVLIKIYNYEKYKNHILQIYILCYSVIRFTDEFWRGDLHRGLYFGLSTSQYISMVLFFIAILSLLREKKLKLKR